MVTNRIGDTGMMIPAIQGSDIGDNEIINGSKIEQVGPDAFQLSYVLPTGRLLQSEPFNSEFRRKAIHPWLDIVRQNIVADAAEAAAVRSRGTIVHPEESDPGSAVPPALAQPETAHGADSVQDVRVGVDPKTFIEAQLHAASKSMEEATVALAEAVEKKKAATAAFYKWKVLKDALTQLPDSPPPDYTGFDMSLLDGEVSVDPRQHKRRRGRPPKRKAPEGTPPQT